MSPTDVVSSFSPPWCHLSSDRCHHTTTSCHASFSWSQDELAVSASYFDNGSSHRLCSRAETEALNPHRRRRPPSSNSSTTTLHFYKKVISILTTLLTIQLCLHFASSLSRAPCHRSLTRRRLSLSSPSHVIVSPHNDTHGDKLDNYLSLLK
jgi:hypothetical protein